MTKNHSLSYKIDQLKVNFRKWTKINVVSNIEKPTRKRQINYLNISSNTYRTKISFTLPNEIWIPHFKNYKKKLNLYTNNT